MLDDAVFDESSLRQKSMSLFDRKLGSIVYNRLQISQNSQTFEKRNGLRAAVERHETEVLSHVDGLHSLGAIPAFRQRLLQLFNDQYTRAFISPFLPPAITSHFFTELLAAVEACCTADDDHLLSQIESTTHLLDAARTEVVQLPTDYAVAIVDGLQARIRQLLGALVRDRGLAEPAEFVMSLPPKKYPLGEVGARVVLRLELENTGTGHALDATVSADGHELVALDPASVELGRVAPGVHVVQFHGRVIKSGDSDAILFRVVWRNASGVSDSREAILELEPQSSDIPWDSLTYEAPYSLEPITDASQFFGRRALLRELSKLIIGGKSVSTTIDGQKRVGKTSLAYALREQVANLRPDEFAFVFIECGDFNLTTPAATIARLGDRICELARKQEAALEDIGKPEFDHGLAPLVDFFEAAERLAPARRFIIVLDEFDAMTHPELYDVGAIGTTLFHSLRSLSGKPNVGFVLIGSERMASVLAAQDTQLNKFRRIQLDYFDRTHLEDYAELIRDPVKVWLKFSDEAIEELYAMSGGNPYITKAACITIFDLAVEARDADIRVEDVRDASDAIKARLGARAFAHFWDDGISGSPEDQKYVSLTRRRVLLAIGDLLRRSDEISEESVISASRAYGVEASDVIEILRGFRERRILLPDTGGILHFRVPVFGEWLMEHGVGELIVTLSDDDALLARLKAEEEARIKPADTEPLSKRWGLYRGSPVSPDAIREWLRQFGTSSDQRLMLAMLNALDFYGGDRLRTALRNLHDFVIRDLAANHGYQYKFRGEQRVRGDLVVTALDGGGSGATHLLRPYRDENRIRSANVVAASEVPKALDQAGEQIRALVILEDFIGTGRTAESRLRDLHQTLVVEASDLSPGIEVYLVVVTGFEEAKARVEQALLSMGWNVHVHVHAPLDDRDRCFSSTSRVYPDELERQRARTLAVERGRALNKSHPLGHEGTEALVIFESRSPNNTLPILWADTDAWTPLFRRH